MITLNGFKNNLILSIIFSLYFAFVSTVFCEEGVIETELDEQTIKKGDLLHITVMGHENLARDVIVNKKGEITFPLIKEIDAEGKTPKELAINMEVELARFIRYPRVTVNYHNTFFIYGEVNRPGEYKLRGHINILKAIVIGGGFTDFASHRVKVIKSSSERKDIWVNVDRIIKGKKKDRDILVEPGDVIVVPQSLF